MLLEQAVLVVAINLSNLRSNIVGRLKKSRLDVLLQVISVEVGHMYVVLLEIEYLRALHQLLALRKL